LHRASVDSKGGAKGAADNQLPDGSASGGEGKELKGGRRIMLSVSKKETGGGASRASLEHFYNRIAEGKG